MEIERKWMVTGWPEGLTQTSDYQMDQGYVSVRPTVRIRREALQGGRTALVLCFKGAGTLSREEIETEIDAERKILKAADRLSAVIKCIEEDRGGNREFEAAYAQQMAALHAMHSPEAEYFIEHMLPCYEQNLDELTRGRF